VAHAASYPAVTGGPFPGIKCGRSVTPTTHHLVLGSRMSRSCFSSPPWCMHGVAGKLYLQPTIPFLYTSHEIYDHVSAMDTLAVDTEHEAL